MRVYGLGFRALGFEDYGLGFRVQGLWMRVVFKSAMERTLRVEGLGLRVQGVLEASVGSSEGFL